MNSQFQKQQRFIFSLSYGASGQTEHGFTLTELVVVIVILGILSAITIPRFADTGVFQARIAADQVTAALRYAQKYAIASHSTITVNLASGTALDCNPQATAGVITCNVPSDVPLNQTVTGAITFNAAGSPNAGNTITVGTTSITIEAETGYVH